MDRCALPKGGYPKSGGQRVHRTIAEKALGKPLPKRAEIHHVDGVKHHNYNSNLVICEDHSYHMLLEARTLVVRSGGNPNIERVCTACKSLYAIGSSTTPGVCRDCKRAIARKFARKVKRISIAGVRFRVQ